MPDSAIDIMTKMVKSDDEAPSKVPEAKAETLPKVSGTPAPDQGKPAAAEPVVKPAPAAETIAVPEVSKAGMAEKLDNATSKPKKLEEEDFPEEDQSVASKSSKETKNGKTKPQLFMGMSILFWALFADAVATLLFIACIPLVLTIAKRRRGNLPALP